MILASVASIVPIYYQERGLSIFRVSHDSMLQLIVCSDLVILRTMRFVALTSFLFIYRRPGFSLHRFWLSPAPPKYLDRLVVFLDAKHS